MGGIMKMETVPKIDVQIVYSRLLDKISVLCREAEAELKELQQR
ncbi:MAG: hypothetical protein ABIH82_02850 [Candidatus Woesearchaeota archaeon]